MFAVFASFINWIVGHPADILICAVVILLAGIGLWNVYKNHKNGCGGCSGCNGGCSSCSQHCDLRKTDLRKK